MNSLKVVLAGQPNCGKSTIFNALSGLYQKVANYPGITVQSQSANFIYKNTSIELIDLPGTYSLSSFSSEEKIAIDMIKNEKPDLIVNILDASNLKRNLYLTFQLLEIGIPVIIVLNMIDVAKRREIQIDIKKLKKMFNVEIISTSVKHKNNKNEILEAIINTKKKPSFFTIDYENIENQINNENRWQSIKKLESIYPQEFAKIRYDNANIVYNECVKQKKNIVNLSQKIDNIVLNRYLAFPILFFVMFLVYELSIVYGYKLTTYTWPLLAGFKNIIVDFLPQTNIIQTPMIRDFTIWMLNSAIALLNYIPVFFILFLLIAIIEDSGYMPRMAFILDKIFKKFGLHGQSTLPLVLGGAMVGGCAVPGVMATKGISDNRARLATILSVPYMNCLAKVPFYTLLLGAFFPLDMALMMFYISTSTLFIALILAKVLTSTVLKSKQTAPFVMELPSYHLPTLKGIVINSSKRVWTYIQKVVSIVLAVAVILFAMMEYPGISSSSQNKYDKNINIQLENFQNKISNNKYKNLLDTKEEVSFLLNFYDNYRAKKMLISSKTQAKALNNKYYNLNKQYFKFLKSKKDKDAKKINKLIRKLSKVRKKILHQIKTQKIQNSFLGMLGRSIEPITKYAGFDWKINVAFISSFAARESAVATLGSLYENNKSLNQRPEVKIKNNSSYTQLHAIAIIVFMILSPPCIATMIVVKMQTNSYKWMIFAIIFPISLGILISSLLFTMSIIYTWSGLETMSYFYFSLVLITLILGLFPSKILNWKTNG